MTNNTTIEALAGHKSSGEPVLEELLVEELFVPVTAVPVRRADTASGRDGALVRYGNSTSLSGARKSFSPEMSLIVVVTMSFLRASPWGWRKPRSSQSPSSRCTAEREPRFQSGSGGP